MSFSQRYNNFKCSVTWWNNHDVTKFLIKTWLIIKTFESLWFKYSIWNARSLVMWGMWKLIFQQGIQFSSAKRSDAFEDRSYQTDHLNVSLRTKIEFWGSPMAGTPRIICMIKVTIPTYHMALCMKHFQWLSEWDQTID